MSCTSPWTEAIGRSKQLPSHSQKEAPLCGLWALAVKAACLPISLCLLSWTVHAAQGIPTGTALLGPCHKFASQMPKGSTILGFIRDCVTENSLKWILLLLTPSGFVSVSLSMTLVMEMRRSCAACLKKRSSSAGEQNAIFWAEVKGFWPL